MNYPPIVTYVVHDVQPRTDVALSAAGKSMKFAAAMVPSGPGTHWMATGETADDARAKLEAMWAKQFPGPSKRGAHLRKKAEAEPDPVDVDDIIL